MQWPVSLPPPAERAGILSGGPGLPSVGGMTRSALAQQAQAVKLLGALWLEETPPERKPGILKCCDPGLEPEMKDTGDIKLIEKPGGHWPVSQKGQ